VPSPNIWQHPATYELENRAVDPGHVLESAMREIADWAGLALLDLGCGTGFHLPAFAESASSVFGVEPHPALVNLARRRTRALANVRVLQGTAQQIPLPAASVDVVQVRWAYFFGPGCEPGLAELARVVRTGGTAFVIDNDAARSTFGSWFRRAHPATDPCEIERFWSVQGWSRVPLDIRWEFGSRADFESVIRIEFSPELADQIVGAHEGTGVEYAVNLWWRRF